MNHKIYDLNFNDDFLKKFPHLKKQQSIDHHASYIVIGFTAPKMFQLSQNDYSLQWNTISSNRFFHVTIWRLPWSMKIVCVTLYPERLGCWEYSGE